MSYDIWEGKLHNGDKKSAPTTSPAIFERTFHVDENSLLSSWLVSRRILLKISSQTSKRTCVSRQHPTSLIYNISIIDL